MSRTSSFRRYTLLALLLSGAFVLMCQPAQAQRPSHYYPARQTFSPYLLYNQVNSTSIPNYYTVFQPARQFRDYARDGAPATYASAGARQALIERDVARILEQEISQRATTGTGGPSVPASFGNHSHFYPVATPRRR